MREKYKKPSADYDFTTNSCFKTLVRNSGDLEDHNLLPFIKKCHYHLDYIPRVFDFEEIYTDGIRIPIIIENNEVIKVGFKMYDKKFDTLLELENFVESESESNYFILCYFLNLKITYCSISFDYHINGLYEDLKEDIRDYKLNKILQ